MTPFQYATFYDVPRTILLRYKGRTIILLSAFDDGSDEFADAYSVIVVPERYEQQIQEQSWDFVWKNDLTPIGTFPVRQVRFDESKRKELDASFLSQFKFD